MQIKEAEIRHIKEMHFIRMSVKENQLSNPNLISEEDYINFIDKKGKTWIAEEQHIILGFATIDLENKNIWALFVNPEFEKKGIGKQLHQTMMIGILKIIMKNCGFQPRKIQERKSSMNF